METIDRKSLLYKSGLGLYCINHVQGCSHGCRCPCYAYMMAKSYGKTIGYADWCQPKLVANAEALLAKELTHKKMKPSTIHLCLSTDPFMTGYDEIIDMSLRLIALINSFDIACSVLTKGSFPSALADTSRFSTENCYTISLISLNEDFRIKWEPGATSYAERIAALKYLHEHGLKTQVHMEPYPTPNLIRQDLSLILDEIGFVDHIFFGGWNYNNLVKEFGQYRSFYSEQQNKIRQFCEDRNIQYAF